MITVLHSGNPRHSRHVMHCHALQAHWMNLSHGFIRGCICPPTVPNDVRIPDLTYGRIPAIPSAFDDRF